MKKLLLGFSLFAFAFSLYAAAAVTYTWTGAGTPNEDGSLNWSDPLNWGKTAGKSTEGATRPAVIANGPVVNCIIWGNENPFDVNDVSTSDTVSCTLSGNADLAGTNGNLSADPQFRNAANGDYRLRRTSPGINAGTTRDWMDGAVDLNGEVRILYGKPDLGCCEKRLNGFMILAR